MALNIKKHVIDCDMRACQAVKKLNEFNWFGCFLITAYKSKYFLVDDSDIRRGLIRGLKLDQPIRDFIDLEKKSLRAQQQQHDVSVCLKALSGREFDLEDFFVLRRCRQKEFDKCSSDFMGIVMAGGFGKRLGKKTQSVPKPLLPIGGKPIILNALNFIFCAKPVKTVISTYYLSEQFDQFIKDHCAENKVTKSLEVKPLGTAGAIGLINEPSATNYVVINADVVTDLKLRNLLYFHHIEENDITICLSTYEWMIPFGVVKFSPGGEFTAVLEKPKNSENVAAGIYVLSALAKAIVKTDEFLNMPDLFDMAKALSLKVGVFPLHEYWADLGTPDDLVAAELRLSADK